MAALDRPAAATAGPPRPNVKARPTTFGAGGAEPYAHALRGGDDSQLFLSDAQREGQERVSMNVARWNASADPADLSLLAAASGPVLDIGCGPARMVIAALALGLNALGIDVSVAAIDNAADAGIPAVLGDVFDAVPSEGRWQTVLLVDGNIGIGGNVSALLARCGELVVPGGHIVVELHNQKSRDRSFTGLLVDTHGRQSAAFPWAEVGLTGVLSRSLGLGLTLLQTWTRDGRSFCRLATAR
ncbi:MAG: methyltransferase domain-containing protein [Microbacteriaceae bacterium]|nr:methyltransferase domain-containing protein [Microbacteriaceae bacterium]